MTKTRKLNSIDRHVAGKIRERREQTGLSQGYLGKALGVSFQQVQKIESCTNRISAGNLWKVSQALGKPIQYFYDGMQ